MEIGALNELGNACSTLDIGYRMLHVYYLVFGAHYSIYFFQHQDCHALQSDPY